MKKAPEYHVIATGRLLGVVLNREKYSFPAGKVDMVMMYPVDFEEFLWALNQRDLADTIFKIYMMDTRILCSKFSIPAKMILTEINALDGFKGTITEIYVAVASKIKEYDLYYWEANGKAELDLVIQSTEGDIIPVEVKVADNVRAKVLVYS